MAGIEQGPYSGPGPGHVSRPVPGSGRVDGLQTRDFLISEDEISGESELKKRKMYSKNDHNSDAEDNSHQGDVVEAETSRRSRGRPPGSKNNPKPPTIVHQESGNALRAPVLQIGDGRDVAESLAIFARRRLRGLSILNGTGTGYNVTLRQPATASAIVTFDGRFEILSLSAAFLHTTELSGATRLTFCLAAGQGQVVGGSVLGAVVASGPILVMAATYRVAPYDRLPLEDDEEQTPMQLYPPGGLSPSFTGAALQQEQHIPVPSSIPVFNVSPNLLGNGQLSNVI